MATSTNKPREEQPGSPETNLPASPEQQQSAASAGIAGQANSPATAVTWPPMCIPTVPPPTFFPPCGPVNYQPYGALPAQAAPAQYVTQNPACQAAGGVISVILHVTQFCTPVTVQHQQTVVNTVAVTPAQAGAAVAYSPITAPPHCTGIFTAACHNTVQNTAATLCTQIPACNQAAAQVQTIPSLLCNTVGAICPQAQMAAGAVTVPPVYHQAVAQAQTATIIGCFMPTIQGCMPTLPSSCHITGIPGYC